MPATNFTDNVTPVVAAWLNKHFGTGGHNHLGLDEDGSAPKISIDELENDLANLLGDLSGIRALIPQLFYQDKAKIDAFGGNGGDGDFTGSFNLTRPYYEFNNFTIPSGFNVQVSRGFCRIKVKGTVLIDGTLNGSPINPGGVGKAWYSTGGQLYNTGVSWLGSAGGETVDHTDLAGLNTIRDRGGFGGAGIIIEALGSIIVNGTIAANGGNAGVPSIISGSPTLGGSGGGSGGSVTLQSFSAIQINGTIDLIGGQGGNGFGSNAAGGGGGAGGVFTAIAPSINKQPTSINVSGGNPGTSTGTGSNAGAGGGGFGGNGGNSKSAGQNGTIIELVRSIYSYI